MLEASWSTKLLATRMSHKAIQGVKSMFAARQLYDEAHVPRQAQIQLVSLNIVQNHVALHPRICTDSSVVMDALGLLESSSSPYRS